MRRSRAGRVRMARSSRSRSSTAVKPGSSEESMRAGDPPSPPSAALSVSTRGSEVYARPAAIASATRSSVSPTASASSARVGVRPSLCPRRSRTAVTRRLISCRERGTRTAQPRSRKRCMISPSIVRAA